MGDGIEARMASLCDNFMSLRRPVVGDERKGGIGGGENGSVGRIHRPGD